MTKRVSVSLPDDLVSDLEFISGRLGISRSAFISGVLSEAIIPAKRLAQILPDGALSLSDSEKGDVARRFRGESADIISEQVRRLLGGGQGDLDL